MESHRRLLEEAGYPVVVLSGRGAGVVIPELDSRHPEVEAITQRLAAGDVPVERFEKLRERVAERLDEVLAGADLVLAHNVLTMHFNLPLAAALAGRRVLAWTHDLAWTNPRYIDFQRDGFPYDILHRPAPGARYLYSLPCQMHLPPCSPYCSAGVQSYASAPPAGETARF